MIARPIGELTKHILLLLALICCSTKFYAQQSDVISDAALSEKIYLQTDGEVYTSDQTIWFKAIVTNSIDHTPTMLSGVLYVELINSKEEVVRRKMLKIDQGTTSGSFELKDAYEEGRYLLRAYTEWSRNFGSDFYFQSYLYVFPPKEEDVASLPSIDNITLDRSGEGLSLKASLVPSLLDSLHDRRLKVYLTIDDKEDSLELKASRSERYQLDYGLPEDADVATIKIKTSNGLVDAKTILVNKDALDLRFFPEGGDLVSGLVSKVGFKAVGSDGKGKRVSGVIVNEKGDEITTFESNKLGMGAMVIQPSSNDSYYAKVASTTDDNLDILYPLPEVKTSGTVMSVKGTVDRISVRVMSNEVKSDSVLVQVSSRGMNYFNVKALMNSEGQLLFNLSTKELPEGVLAFKLMNKRGDPIGSRLYFHEKTDDRLKIDVELDKQDYLQREKATIKARVTDELGVPVDTKLSMLVINKAQLGDLQAKRQNILSYFLMNSDLRGHVENAGYYFKTENEGRLRDLDFLMLTQGWSRYKYKELTLPEDQEYKPELGLTVSGTVTDLIRGKKAKKGIGLTMTTFGDTPSFDTQSTDDLGRFSFTVGDAFGESMPVLIQTKRKGKRSSYNIVLDEKLSPKFRFSHEVSIQEADSTIYALVEKHQERKLVNDAYDFSTRIRDLGEVIVEDYALTPLREEMMKKYGKPNVVIEGDEIRENEQKWSSGLYSVLVNTYPEIFSLRTASRINPRLAVSVVELLEVRGSNWPLPMVDGIPVRLEQWHLLPSLPVSEVKSFELIKNSKGFEALIKELFSPFPAPSVLPPHHILAIYTYAGTGLSLKGTKGIFNGAIPAFSYEREFYAPKYKNLTNEDWVKPDYRALVHWLPDAVTDENGVVETEFYNADNLGEMLVVVEAISSDGQIGYQEMVFIVEERKR